MLDLTAIERPFGLLDMETKRALLAHGGPYEVYQEGRWKAISTPSFQPSNVYRAIPTFRREPLRDVLRDLMAAYALANGEDHPAYQAAERAVGRKVMR
jgi:hypothetical protein